MCLTVLSKHFMALGHGYTLNCFSELQSFDVMCSVDLICQSESDR
jgi:hypothetical protein